ncbi:hypothetical protein CR513_12192, partial [Mucuna pruriens]
MLRKCPHHDFPKGINTTCRGMIKKESLNETYVIIKDMTSNTYHYSLSDRHVTRRPAKLH